MVIINRSKCITNIVNRYKLENTSITVGNLEIKDKLLGIEKVVPIDLSNFDYFIITDTELSDVETWDIQRKFDKSMIIHIDLIKDSIDIKYSLSKYEEPKALYNLISIGSMKKLAERSGVNTVRVFYPTLGRYMKEVRNNINVQLYCNKLIKEIKHTLNKIDQSVLIEECVEYLESSETDKSTQTDIHKFMLSICEYIVYSGFEEKNFSNMYGKFFVGIETSKLLELNTDKKSLLILDETSDKQYGFIDIPNKIDTEYFNLYRNNIRKYIEEDKLSNVLELLFRKFINISIKTGGKET